MVENPHIIKPPRDINKETFTVGVLFGNFNNQYDSLHWAGIADGIEDNKINSITFITAPLTSESSAQLFNTICYKLIDPERLDHLIIQSGVLVAWVGYDVTKQLVQHYSQLLPVENTNLAIDGRPIISTENYTGMFELVEHLIVDHDYKRIAFVTGPPTHEEAEDRFCAYRDALTKYGYPIDKQLIATGNLMRAGGKKAVQQLYDGRNDLQIEAVVCANDTMAKVVIAELQERGYRVPEDVAVTGFDDITDAQYFEPPLTTVHQPIYQQGHAVIDNVVKHGGSQNASKKYIKMPTKLVRRASCGCEYDYQSLNPTKAKDAWLLRMAQTATMMDSNARQFMQAHTWEQFAQTILRVTKSLGMTYCYIFKFENSAESNTAHLHCGVQNGKLITEQAHFEQIVAHKLLPPSLWETHTHFNMVVSLLHFEGKAMGYLITDSSIREGWLYESFRTQITTLIKTISLLENEKSYAQELEQQVAQRTQELEQLLQERSEWLRIVAHDLRNPLSVITLSTSSLRLQGADEVNPSSLDSRLERVEKSAAKMDSIISRLVTFGMAEGEALIVESQHTDVGKLLTSIISEQQPTAAAKNIQLQLNVISSVQGMLDPGLFGQIATNLISNAVKYSHFDSEVNIALCEENNTVQLVVADNGLGFTKEDKGRMFQKYARLSAKPTANEDSVGLGLFIVHKFVSAMNGEIVMQSAGRGLGSTFIVTIPLAMG